MSNFKERFHAAVHSVAAEMEAMDDAAFEKLLAEHRDGDIAQILREMDFSLIPESSVWELMHAEFIPSLPQVGHFRLGDYVAIQIEKPKPHGAMVPDECLTAA